MRNFVLIIVPLLLVSVSVHAGLYVAPAVEIVATDVYADEIHSATDGASAPDLRDATFVISRRCCTADSLRVNYSVSGTALNGVDYLRLSGSVIIPAGRMAARIVIKAIDDQIIDRDEIVIITLRPNQRYTLGPRTKARAFIADSGVYHDGGGFIGPPMVCPSCPPGTVWPPFNLRP